MSASREDLEVAYINALLEPSENEMDLELFPDASFFEPLDGSVSLFPEAMGPISSDVVSSSGVCSVPSALSGGGDAGGSQGPRVSNESSGPWMGATPGMERWDTRNGAQTPKPDEVAIPDSGTDSGSFDSGAWEEWRKTIDEIRSRSESPVREKEEDQRDGGRMREKGRKAKREEEEDQDLPLKKKKKVKYDLNDPSLPAYHRRRLLRQRKSRKKRSDLAKRMRMVEARKEMDKIMRGEFPKGKDFNCPHCGEVVVAFEGRKSGEEKDA